MNPLTPSLAVVVHDVAAATLPACERLLAAVREVADVPLTLLAVPRYHGDPNTRAFIDWLDHRYVAGDEVALHGYTHRDDGAPSGPLDYLRRRHYTRGEGEFAALTRAEAQRRITAGVLWFARHGFVVHGFVAPAWLMSRGTWDVLDEAGLAYTCTLRRIVVLPGRETLVSQSVVYSTSSAWRRQASLAWTAAVAAVQRHRPLLRLELHPGDADPPRIRHAWQRLLDEHLAQGREPLTLAALAERLRQAPARARLRPPAPVTR